MTVDAAQMAAQAEDPKILEHYITSYNVPKNSREWWACREIHRLRDSSADDLRAKGWLVAVHNDYRQGGRSHTFWLLTHSNGHWLKGEGEDDAYALNSIRRQLENYEDSLDESDPYFDWLRSQIEEARSADEVDAAELISSPDTKTLSEEGK